MVFERRIVSGVNHCFLRGIQGVTVRIPPFNTSLVRECYRLCAELLPHELQFVGRFCGHFCYSSSYLMDFCLTHVAPALWSWSEANRWPRRENGHHG
jgi:hypothetical protein